MRNITKQVFTINELNNSAKEHAYYKWLDSYDYSFDEENMDTLKEFMSIFNITIHNWEYDSSSYHYRFELEHNDDIQELSSIRLLKYLWNNYKNNIYKGKYYSLWSKKDKNPHYKEKGHAPYGKLKKRHSKIIIESGTCPLTGYHMDYAILNPIHEFMKKPDNRTFYDLIDDCLESFFKDCRDDFAGCTSMEYFIEEAENNEWEFYEDGHVY